MTTLPMPTKPEWAKPVVMYGKTLELVEWGRYRRYKWGDEYLKSVTTILGETCPKPMLIQWAADMAVEHVKARMPDLVDAFQRWRETEINKVWEEARTAHTRIKEEAGDIGQQVHDYAQARLEGKPLPPPSVNPEVMRGIEAFEDWLRTHFVEPGAIERRCMSLRGKYAGTCDFLGKIDGEPVLLDFKTSKGVYDDHWIQMGGYDDALHEEWDHHSVDMPSPAHWLIHLSKETGEFAAYRRSSVEVQVARDLWRNCLARHQLNKLMPKMPRKKAAA